jgi:hypothetical protein
MSLTVNDGGTNKEVQEVLIKDGGVWKQVNEVHIKDDGTWKLAFGVTYVTLSNEGTTGVIKDFNLATYLSITSPTIVAVTVSAGTHFVSTDNTVPAFDVGSLPIGSSVTLSIPADATITGRGGNGGYGSNSEGAQSMGGDFGGTGLYTRYALSLTNNGLIGGGGGGGGGAGGRVVYNAAGSGGGGAGGYHESINSNAIIASDGTTGLSPGANELVPAGVGGIGAGPRTDGSTSPRASDGTRTTGGAGSSDVYGNRTGGTGGNLGAVGLAVVAAGGAAGNAIDGHSYITYVTSGTISGGQVN